MSDIPFQNEGNIYPLPLTPQPKNPDENLLPESFDSVKALASENTAVIQESQTEPEHDGPLFLALLMGNNNLNAALNKEQLQDLNHNQYPIHWTRDLHCKPKPTAIC